MFWVYFIIWSIVGIISLFFLVKKYNKDNKIYPDYITRLDAILITFGGFLFGLVNLVMLLVWCLIEWIGKTDWFNKKVL